MMKREKPQQWVQNENRDIGNMVFRFKDKESPRAYISNIVNSLQVSGGSLSLETAFYKFWAHFLVLSFGGCFVR